MKKSLLVLISLISVMSLSSCSVFDLFDAASSVSEVLDKAYMPEPMEDRVDAPLYYLTSENENGVDFIKVYNTRELKLLDKYVFESYYKKSSGFTKKDFEVIEPKDYNVKSLDSARIEVREDRAFVIVTVSVENLRENSEKAVQDGFITIYEGGNSQYIDGSSFKVDGQLINEEEYKTKISELSAKVIEDMDLAMDYTDYDSRKYYLTDETDDYIEFVNFCYTKKRKALSEYIDEVYYKKSSGYTMDDIKTLTLADFGMEKLIGHIEFSQDNDYVILKIVAGNLQDNWKSAIESGLLTMDGDVNDYAYIDGSTLNISGKEITYQEYMSIINNNR